MMQVVTCILVIQKAILLLHILDVYKDTPTWLFNRYTNYYMYTCTIITMNVLSNCTIKTVHRGMAEVQ